MVQHFDSKEYIKHLASELIRNFAFSSSATTPVLVGSAREKEVIRKLELLLPKSIAVGSGCVIDSYGKTSKQMDIVLYEKDLCPIFCINESAETTYYPCEGVIAVGEIKSTLNTKELENIFEKASSVKMLKRHSIPSKSQFTGEDYFAFRKYGVRTAFEGEISEDFDQKNKSTDQIYCFALCGELGITPQTLKINFSRLLKESNFENEINLISILNYGLVFYYNEEDNRIKNTIKEADSFFITAKRENNFEFLLSTLNNLINLNRTVDISAYHRYISINDSVELTGGMREIIDID